MKLIREVDKLIQAYRETDNNIFDMFSQHYYDVHFSNNNSVQYETLSNILFCLITNEPNFREFYNRFESPGFPDGKPVAWDDGGFLPDQIFQLLMSDQPIKDRVNKISALYRKCIKLERK